MPLPSSDSSTNWCGACLRRSAIALTDPNGDGASCPVLFVTERIDPELVEALRARDDAVVLVPVGDVVPTAAAVSQVLATGKVARFASPWLPDEAEKILGSETWNALRPSYLWLPPSANHPAAGRTGATIHWIVERIHAEVDDPLLAAVTEAFSSRAAVHVLCWPIGFEVLRATEVPGLICVVGSHDALALAWAVDGAGTDWQAVLDQDARLSCFRSFIGGALVAAPAATLNLRRDWLPVIGAVLDPRRLGGAFAVPANSWREMAKGGPVVDEAVAMVARLSWQVRAGLRPFDPANLEESLFVGLMDGQVHGWRRGWAERLLARLGEVGMASCPELAFVLALSLGRVEQAETLWRTGGAAAWRLAALWRMPRIWTLALGAEVSGRANTELKLGCRLSLELLAEAPSASSCLVVAILQLCAGDDEAALDLCRRGGDDLGPGAWHSLAIHAWAAGSKTMMDAVGAHMAGRSATETVNERFHRTIAASLIGGSEDAGTELERLYAEETGFFAPATPAHSRCLFAAVALAALGRAEPARACRARALVEDPAAELRQEIWVRACRQGKVEP